MSHATVLVLTRPWQTVEDLLAPYDENVEVDPYIDMTKDDLIRYYRGRQEQAAEHRKEFLTDPASYVGLRNLEHMRWIIDGARDQAALSDEQLFEQVVVLRHKLDEDGNTWTTYNPKSKWDWWTVGGRWPKQIHVGDLAGGRDTAPLSTINWKRTERYFAILTPDGEWHERGKLGWFGSVGDAKDDWDEQHDAIIAGITDPHEVTATSIDFHI